jgi:hypothetical protein
MFHRAPTSEYRRGVFQTEMGYRDREGDGGVLDRLVAKDAKISGFDFQ